MAETNPNPVDRLSQNDDKDTEHYETRKNNVRRRLDFGPEEVDEEVMRMFQGENQVQDRQRAIEKWNFDFENEVPLTGDWEWEKVLNQAPVPNSKDVLVTIKDKLKENRNV